MKPVFIVHDGGCFAVVTMSNSERFTLIDTGTHGTGIILEVIKSIDIQLKFNNILNKPLKVIVFFIVRILEISYINAISPFILSNYRKSK